jgi:DNA-binding transcriptional regulator YhcF (GntR family)
VQINQKSFEREQASVFSEAQRLESELDRGKEEVERREEQANLHTMDEVAATAKANAQSAAKAYFEGLQETVMERLAAAGHFYDPVTSQVEALVLPWILEKVASTLEQMKSMRAGTDQILEGSIALGMKQVADKREDDRLAAEQEHERLRQAEEERLRIVAELVEQRIQAEARALAAAEAEAKALADAEGNEGEENGEVDDE